MDGQLRNMTAIYLFKEEKVLLLHRNGGKVANQLWIGSAGGHFEKHELNNAKACVLREMKEELGLNSENIENLSLRYITLRNTQRETRQNYYFFASLKTDRVLKSTEGVLKWFPYEEAATLNMPVSAKHMMRHYLTVGRFDETLYAGITEEQGTSFVPLSEFEG